MTPDTDPPHEAPEPDFSEDMFLAGEATMPIQNDLPLDAAQIRSRLPKPTLSELSELESRVEHGQTPVFPKERARNIPLAFLRRQIRALSSARHETVLDNYGRDPQFADAHAKRFEWLYRSYFRTLVEGEDNLPPRGGAILVCNHAGLLPWDILMVCHAVQFHTPGKRLVRPLIEDGLFDAPYLGPILQRLGALRANPENAERLLHEGHLIAVFPEGKRGTAKLWSKRLRLERFGRNGFVKLALGTQAPVIPTALLGAEDTTPTLVALKTLGKLLGSPYLPVTPTFPLLGPVGLLPLPAKWRIRFGAPRVLHVDSSPGAEPNPLYAGQVTSEIRNNIQDMLASLASARGNPFL